MCMFPTEHTGNDKHQSGHRITKGWQEYISISQEIQCRRRRLVLGLWTLWRFFLDRFCWKSAEGNSSRRFPKFFFPRLLYWRYEDDQLLLCCVVAWALIKVDVHHVLIISWWLEVSHLSELGFPISWLLPLDRRVSWIDHKFLWRNLLVSCVLVPNTLVCLFEVNGSNDPYWWEKCCTHTGKKERVCLQELWTVWRCVLYTRLCQHARYYRSSYGSDSPC